MKSSLKLGTCLVVLSYMIVSCTVGTSAQVDDTQDTAASQPSTSPTAYVYVVTNPTSSTSELDGYGAASDGTLTKLPGSPFWTSNTQFVTGLANTAHWLFVSDGVYIYSFSIGSNGALKKVSSINAAQYYPYGGLVGASLVLDHTGSTLYAAALDGTGDNEFQFFTKNSATGALSYSGSTAINIAYGELLFATSNQYAYGFGCFQDSTFDYAFSRGSNGTLTPLNVNIPIPTYPDGDYCLDMAAAAPANNLAVAMYLETTGPPNPPAWLGVYTADSSGNLTTNSTSQNMVTSEVGNLNDMAASPAGNLLAVGGDAGLQVFFFNGGNPITAYTGFIAEHRITQLKWDNHNHLFGISSSGRLYAFKVTATGYKQAQGSPYSIPFPRAISVLSK